MKYLIALLLTASMAWSQTNIVFYDGINFWSKSGATNRCIIQAINIGNMTLSTNGITITNNYGWEDLRFPVGVAAPVTPNADVVLDVANNAITFAEGGAGASTNFGTGANVDHVWGVAQMPHTWRTNTAVHPHVHFIQRFGDETNCWYMYYRVQPISGVTNSAWTFIGAATNEYAFTGTSIHQLAELPAITIPGRASTIIDWKIFALGSSVSNDLIFKEFDIHYQIEKPTGEIF